MLFFLLLLSTFVLSSGQNYRNVTYSDISDFAKEDLKSMDDTISYKISRPIDFIEGTPYWRPIFMTQIIEPLLSNVVLKEIKSYESFKYSERPYFYKISSNEGEQSPPPNKITDISEQKTAKNDKEESQLSEAKKEENTSDTIAPKNEESELEKDSNLKFLNSKEMDVVEKPKRKVFSTKKLLGMLSIERNKKTRKKFKNFTKSNFTKSSIGFLFKKLSAYDAIFRNFKKKKNNRQSTTFLELK